MRPKLTCLLFALLALNLSGCTAWYAVEQWKCNTFGLCPPGMAPGHYGGYGGYGAYGPSNRCPPGGTVTPYPAAPYGGYGGVVPAQ